MKFSRLLVACACGLALPSFAVAQEQAWVQIESYPSEATARARAAAYAGEFSNVQIFHGKGWYAITLGPYAPGEAAGTLADLRRAGRVPRDAFITDAAGLVASETALPGAAAAPTDAAPAADAPAEVAPAAPALASDETVKEARASESALQPDERRALQEALKWYGFYDAAIDGSFGAGTRKSMATWQEANGFEPTGILTTLQRATLVTNHHADLAEFGFETLTEAESGIEITLPMALLSFDRYDPPFVHYAAKDGSGLQVMLISEPGGDEALAGLYDILQTLEAMPPQGVRARDAHSFHIEGVSDKVHSRAYGEARNGTVKGYLVVWNPKDNDRMARILPALQSSFRPVGDKALDPGLVPMEEAERAGMLAGLETRRPARVASGFFVDGAGHLATSLANVAGCTKITIGAETAADILAQDDENGIALLAASTPMAPLAVAHLANASPLPGADLAVAGYSYGARLPAAVLTFGSFDAAEGLMGETGQIRFAAPLMAGDMGGPVLDAAGQVVGLATPQADDAAKKLPEGMAIGANAAALSALMQSAGLAVEPAPPAPNAPLSPDAMNTAALGMTVQISCWQD